MYNCKKMKNLAQGANFAMKSLRVTPAVQGCQVKYTNVTPQLRMIVRQNTIRMQMTRSSLMTNQSQMRQFSKNEQESEFDKYMREGTQTDEQKKEGQQKMQEKEEEQKLQKERARKDREDFEKKTREEFEKMLDGGNQKGITEDMNLQDIFKQFYSQAKTVDVKSKIQNSAMSSLGGFSAKLEKRRQAAREAKETKQQKETQKANKAPKDQATDSSKDQATETTEERVKQEATDKAKDSGQTETETKADPTPEKEQEQNEEESDKKQSLYEKYQARKESYNSTIEEKYPRLHSYKNTFNDVWEETFPNHDAQMAKRMEHRKKMAKMQREAEELEKEMTQEEIDAMEESIPEWKRNALTVTDSEVQEEKKGVFGRMKQKVGDRISQTEAAQKFKESEDYEKIKEMRSNYSEFKNNLSDGIENTQNPMVQRAVAAADLVYTESSCAKAIKNMQAYDPYFEFEELENEATEIFKEFYTNFLVGNLEYLEIVSGGPALAICKTEIKRRKTEKWAYKYEEMLDCGRATFNSGQMDKVPSFTYIIDTQEIDCKICTSTDEIKEGTEDNIMKNSWRITISRHEDPDIEVTGHYWEVTELAKVGELKQLV